MVLFAKSTSKLTSGIGGIGRHTRLRNYRQLSSSCKGAINSCYLTPFFKKPTFAVVQVVLQHTQQIFRNTTVVQSISGECSRYVY